MRILSAISICVLLFSKPDWVPAAEPIKTLTPLEYKNANPKPTSVQLRGVVTYHDAAGGMLCLEQNHVAVFVRVPTTIPLISPGMQILVRCGHLNGMLDSEELIEEELKPVPLPSIILPNELNHGTHAKFVSLRGVVRRADIEERRAILAVEYGRQIHRVFIARTTKNGPTATELIDSEVEIRGVVTSLSWTSQPLKNVSILLNSFTDLEIRNPAPREPFQLPKIPINNVPNWAAHRVKISGTIVGPIQHGLATINDGTGSINVPITEQGNYRDGERLEVVGFPALIDRQATLTEPLIRGFATREHGVPHKPQDMLPILTSVRQIRSLSTTELQLGYPVRLRGRVTYNDFNIVGHRMLFIQDEQMGIYVNMPDPNKHFVAGSLVDVIGFSDPGGFAPMINACEIRFIRQDRLPVPRLYSSEEFLAGASDSQWVRIVGIVCAVHPFLKAKTMLTVRHGNRTLRCFVPDLEPEKATEFIGRTVSIQGACGSKFDNGRWVGTNLFVPGMRFIESLTPETELTAKRPPVPIDQLTQYDRNRTNIDLVKIAGYLTSRNQQTITVQDDTGAIVVRLLQDQECTIGDWVEVTGVLNLERTRWQIEEATTRVQPAPLPPLAPKMLLPEEVIKTLHPSSLIRVDGRLLHIIKVRASNFVMAVQSYHPQSEAEFIFSVVVPSSDRDTELLELKPGTCLQFVGVRMDVSDQAIVSRFRLLVPDSQSIVILSRPPWLDQRKLIMILTAISATALIFAFWVFTLRRRVHQQTQQIHAQLAAETLLEERYRDLIESANDIVFTLDHGGRVVSLNPGGFELTGFELGKAIRDSVSPDSQKAADEIGICEGPLKRELIINSDHGPLYLDVSAKPILKNGQWCGVQAIGHNVTQQRKLEADLRQAQKMEAIGRLAGGIAHDFNNLLTVINGNASMLKMITEDEQAEIANEIVEAGERAAALTKQLLTFSRKGVISPKVFCPNDTIENMRRILTRIVGERIQVITNLDPDAGCVHMDDTQLEQAILNLAVNARDAMPHGGQLTINTTTWIGHVRLTVTDTGHGMDRATLSQIFEPFFSTKRIGEGTGIGLATVKNVVEQAQGKISVQSEVGQGTTFIIDIPVTNENPSLEDIPYGVEAHGKKQEVILLVEDEPSVQLLQRRVLEGAKYHVLTANHAAEALAVLESTDQTVSLLLTDVVMPGMNGRELAEQVAIRWPQVKTLFMSGYTPDEVLREGIRTEAVHFLQKPFSPSTLLAKVHEILLETKANTVSIPTSSGGYHVSSGAFDL